MIMIMVLYSRTTHSLPVRSAFMKISVLRCYSTQSRDTTSASLPMDRPELARVTRWWDDLSPASRASYRRLIYMHCQPLTAPTFFIFIH